MQRRAWQMSADIAHHLLGRIIERADAKQVGQLAQRRQMQNLRRLAKSEDSKIQSCHEISLSRPRLSRRG